MGALREKDRILMGISLFSQLNNQKTKIRYQAPWSKRMYQMLYKINIIPSQKMRLIKEEPHLKILSFK